MLRVEACTGEKRTSLSSSLLQVMLCFRLPCPGPFFHGAAADNLREEGTWSDQKALGVTDIDWPQRLAMPCKSHQEFIDDIQALCAQHPGQMGRKDKKGRTIRQILMAGVLLSLSVLVEWLPYHCGSP